MPIFPIFSDPGSTISPSSVITITPGLRTNLAVSAGLSLEALEDPIPPSVEPIASTRTMSWCFKSPCLTSELHITPLDIIVFIDSRL